MFDKTQRDLQALEQGVQIPIQFQLDDKGFLDRRCPSQSCRVEYKVLSDDWRDKVRDDVVYCPLCRFEAESGEWNTEAQEEHIRQTAFAYFSELVGGALEQDAQQFNASQPRGGLISMSMSVERNSSAILIPPQAVEAMRQQFVCERCSCRYSSLGAAFFCPACGHNSAKSTFKTTIETVRSTVANLPGVRAAVETAADKDTAENMARESLESSLVRLVAAFQRLAEATFHDLPNASAFTVRKNLFQNLNESSTLWKTATGKGFEVFVSLSELSELRIFFQQRHLLSHRDGLVDQEYLTKSGDTSYAVGQRLIIKDQAVLRLGDLVAKLANQLGK